MQELICTSFITLGISITSVSLLSRFRDLLKDSSIVACLDQFVRAIMLSFAIYHIGSELLEIFSIKSLLAMSLGFFAVQQLLISVSHRIDPKKYIHENHPWLIYTLLIPHFITEGFMIAPQAAKSGMSLVIAGFLVHKTFEVTMLTMNTNNNIHCQFQRIVLQTIFIILTPIAIILHTPFKTLWSMNHTLMGCTEFLNFIVFVQLSVFCKFCPHNHKAGKDWFVSNQCFIASFTIISICVFFYPELLIASHH